MKGTQHSPKLQDWSLTIRWFGLVLWHINHCRLFSPKTCLYIYIKNIWFVNIFIRWVWSAFFLHTVICFQVLLCTTNNSIKHQSLVSTQLNDQTVLFQAIQFVCNQLKCQTSIWPIDRTLSGVTTPGQSGPRSNGNAGVLCIPQSTSITGSSP